MTLRMSGERIKKSDRWMCWCWIIRKHADPFCKYCYDTHSKNALGLEKLGWQRFIKGIPR